MKLLFSLLGYILNKLKIRFVEPESLRRADRNSWQNSPMPAARVEIQVPRIFTEAEYAQISYGYIPDRMEQKWFIYLEDDWLYFHRSWTGQCIFQLKLMKDGAAYFISEAWLNIENREDQQQSYDSEIAMLLDLIDNLLLRNIRSG